MVGAAGCASVDLRLVEGRVVGPGVVALGVAEVGFVAPEDVAPVGAAGLDAVFVDEVPDDLFEGDAAGWEVEAWEGFLACVVPRSGVNVQVGARVSGWGVPLVVVLKHGARVVAVTASLVGERGIRHFKA